MIFFYGRGTSFVRCCSKNLLWRPARFFRSSTTEVVFRPTAACFHLLGRENVRQPQKKKFWFTDTDRKKFWPTSVRKDGRSRFKQEASSEDADRTFLIDFIQIIFRDIIEITIADIGHCKAATDIFQKTLRNFFYKRWPIIFFFTVEVAF